MENNKEEEEPLKKGTEVNNNKVKEKSALSGEKPPLAPEQHSEDHSTEIRMKEQPLNQSNKKDQFIGLFCF